MKIEFEATFTDIDKDEMRDNLKGVGAKLLRPEFLQKRCTFKLPKDHEIEGGWLRVRDEGDKITMSLKVIDGDKITDQKETMLTVDSFEEAVSFLESIGCRQKSYQETKRELWMLDDVEVTIDEWPFLEPFVEVEGETEEVVKKVSAKLEFDYTKAKFCAIGTLYSEKYNTPADIINNDIPKIVFEMDNPFIK